MELPTDYTKLDWMQRKAVRERYVELQGGLCSHCKRPLNSGPSESVAVLKVNRRLFPETFFKWPVHLHHSHVTGMTIGAVHNHCNAVLWQHHGE